MSRPPMVLPLAEAHDRNLTGGKAVNLYQLMEAGLPVPDGFVVTTAAFHGAGKSPLTPPEVEKAVRAAYRAMGEPVVAVRSSATAEDLAEASMAGQYETYLDVTGADAVLLAIEKCWASLEAERVQTYLREHSIDPTSVAVAVVVQELVPAEVSGVLFTANPRSGSEEEMIIEAVYGLGEGLVSGEVQPDIYNLNAHDASVLDIQIATKNRALRPDHRDYQDVDPALAGKACLDYPQLQSLVELGHLAQSHFRGPQDIEWAWAQGKAYVLQARAITTLAETQAYHRLLNETQAQLEAAAEQGRGPWVCHNLSETLPLPTPLTWSLIHSFMSGDGGFGHMHRHVGFTPSDVVASEGFLELIAGRIYLDCARLPEMFCAGYPYRYDIDQLRTNPSAAQQPPNIPQGSYRQLAAAAKLGKTVTENIRTLAQTLDNDFDGKFIPRVQVWYKEQAKQDLQQLSDSDLITHWQTQQRQVLDDFGAYAFLPSMVEALATTELESFLAEHIWDEEAATLLECLSASPIMDATLRSNVELQEVAQGKRSLASWLEHYGFRGPGEFDLAKPRWFEQPEAVQQLAQQLADSADLESRHQERYAEAEACLQRLKQGVTQSLATQLEQHVTLLQRYLRFREDGKAVLMMAFAQLRRTVLEFGRRLGLEDELFFLTKDELVEALELGFVPQDRMEKRLREYRAALQLNLPHVFEATDLAELGQAPEPNAADTWSAFAVSHGCCTGTARIVFDPTAAHELGHDYILVCPSTDPAWTPLFVKANGLILERGGSLSHGAIVAREMGLPAVVLANATTLLAEGDTVTVDANRGRVSRGQEPSEAALADDPKVDTKLIPPPPGQDERQGNLRALYAALAWGLFLGLVYLLPNSWLKEPVFQVIDTLLWPWVPRVGMVWTVAFVGAFFAVVPLLIQHWATDNARLWEAKKRATHLEKASRDFPAGCARRQAMLNAAAPITKRTLKASMVGLAWILGPMMLVFLWMPDRMDPAAWNAEPGGLVTISAEIDGEYSHDVTLAIPEALSLDTATPATQQLPPIRQTLEELRREWQESSDLSDYPWPLQTAGDQAQEILLTSLNAYLKTGVPPQKLTWMLHIPNDANGYFPVTLSTPDKETHTLKLTFGNTAPPSAAQLTPIHGPILTLEATYPRPLHQRRFWTPLKHIGGPTWDFGWLGVYILSYLLIMLMGKKLLRIP